MFQPFDFSLPQRLLPPQKHVISSTCLKQTHRSSSKRAANTDSIILMCLMMPAGHGFLVPTVYFRVPKTKKSDFRVSSLWFYPQLINPNLQKIIRRVVSSFFALMSSSDSVNQFHPLANLNHIKFVIAAVFIHKWETNYGVEMH